jgi:lipopolysaccharide export LptBFGC system permease protein LptF
MKTLDRYVLRSFIFCCIVVFFVFIGLRIIADLFVNMDEFVKGGREMHEVIGHVLNYYGAQSLLYIMELGGIAVTFGAAFTLARMNKTNELTAMLASGVSLYRVLLPIFLGSVVLVGLLVVDREFLVPRIAPRLAVDRGERAETEIYQVRMVPDAHRNVWYAGEFQPFPGLLEHLTVTLRDDQGRPIGLVAAQRATPAQLDPGVKGWDAKGARLVGPQEADWSSDQFSQYVYTGLDQQEILAAAGFDTGTEQAVTVQDFSHREDPGHYSGMLTAARRIEIVPAPAGPRIVLVQPRFTFRVSQGREKRDLAVIHAPQATWNSHESRWDLVDGAVFVRSDLGPQDILLRQSSRWLEYVSFTQLGELIDKGMVADVRAAQLSRHLRITEPINLLLMLLLPMPFILSRERNVKASVGVSVLVVGLFYVSMYMIRYVDNIPAAWAAWLPTLVFGPIAVVLLDSIKT